MLRGHASGPGKAHAAALLWASRMDAGWCLSLSLDAIVADRERGELVMSHVMCDADSLPASPETASSHSALLQPNCSLHLIQELDLDGTTRHTNPLGSDGGRASEGLDLHENIHMARPWEQIDKNICQSVNRNAVDNCRISMSRIGLLT